jgi:hypothetical protein
VHRAALPGAGEHLRDRMLEPLVVIGDRQAHPIQATGSERSEELDPEAAGFDLADVQADHLPHPGLVHRIGHNQRL